MDEKREHRLRLEVRRAGSQPAQAKRPGRTANFDQLPSDIPKTARGRRPPPSTNVSSPVAGLSKKRKTKPTLATVEDREDDDGESEAGLELHANGYGRDDFVVSDEEEDEDAFEPRPRRRNPQPHRRQQTLEELGPSISRDPRLDEAGLDEIHQDIVHAFVERAQKMEENLRNKHGLRRPLFTEQQYREMAIRWTTTVAQMYTIRGVDKSKVDLYGTKFTTLIQQFHDRYQEMMGRTVQSFSAVEMGPRERRRREVVDLISDDEDDGNASHGRGFQSGVETEAGGYDEEDFDQEVEDEEDLEPSRYFADAANQAPSLSRPDTAAVEQWHRRFEELDRARKPPKSTYSDDGGSRTSGGNWRGGKKSFGKYRGGKSGFSRGGGGPSFSGASTAAGVTKRRGSVGRQQGRGNYPSTSGSVGNARGRPASGSKKSGSGAGSIPSMPY